MTPVQIFKRTIPLLAVLFGATASADALDEIIERGTIRVGVAEFVPLTMKAKAGGYIGYDIDVANKIARDMGVTAEFSVYAWEDIIPALENDKIDVVAGTMAITPQRALRVNFSWPLATSGAGLATNTSMTQDIETLEQLNDPDIVIATVTDTFSDGVARTIFNRAAITSFPTKDLAEKEILEGRAHVYVSSLPAVRFLEMNNEGRVDLPLREPLLAYSEGVAVRKGEQELLNFLNAWVTARSTDKWLATTHDYWFGTLDWIEDVAK
jgi:polar amino acid transport system substrate-binding protein